MKVDLFGPKEIGENFQWRHYTKKLDSLPPSNLLAVCATREGALLRFWRLARRKWSPERSGRRLLSEEFVDRLADLGMPAVELDLVAREIRDGCPWLDAIYAEHSV